MSVSTTGTEKKYTPVWIKIAADKICEARVQLTRADVREIIADQAKRNITGYPEDGECFSCGCFENEDGECQNSGCYRWAAKS